MPNVFRATKSANAIIHPPYAYNNNNKNHRNCF